MAMATVDGTSFQTPAIPGANAPGVAGFMACGKGERRMQTGDCTRRSGERGEEA